MLTFSSKPCIFIFSFWALKITIFCDLEGSETWFSILRENRILENNCWYKRDWARREIYSFKICILPGWLKEIQWNSQNMDHVCIWLCVHTQNSAQERVYLGDCQEDVKIILKLTFFSLSGGWSPTGSTQHGSHWLAYCSLPRVIVMMENLVEWRLAGETEVLGEIPPQRHIVHHKSHLALFRTNRQS
jgi:hypothetical protein